MVHFADECVRPYILFLIENVTDASKLVDIQNRFTLRNEPRSPRFIPCYSVKNALDAILRLTDEEDSRRAAMQRFQEIQSVMHSVEEAGASILFNIPGMTQYEVDVLLQAMGSIRNIIVAESPDAIYEKTPLSIQQCTVIWQFFHPNAAVDETILRL